MDWEENDGEDDGCYGAHDLAGEVGEDVVEERVAGGGCGSGGRGDGGV